MRWYFFILLFSFLPGRTAGQKDITPKIDSLISANTKKPFNGIILISQNGRTIYSKIYGFENLKSKEPLKQNSQFVIGSISKQITATIILQQYDKGLLKLNIPIHSYLPELKQGWADTVTIHQLLTHTHGIVQLDKPLAFIAGSQFSYSQIGYDILAKILEKITKKSFATLAAELFEKCEMKNSFHPDLHQHKNLVPGYTESKSNKINLEKRSLQTFVAAGSFISTASDMVLWNNHLFGGKLLKDSTLRLMTTKQKGARRNHPVFGKTDYGYGITIDTKDHIVQYGQTGFVPGFVSMNFYFPETKTSVVVLENIAYDNNIKKTFYYHTEILKLLRESDILK
jgi:D-alanyl-D-alanine carboxypeptidase